MKKIKKAVSLVLTLCMILCLAPVNVSATGNVDTTEADTFQRIFSLDCGRRYFTVEQIEGMIDELEKNNYTHLQLAVGNDGFRFLLNDMSVSVNEKTYSSEEVITAIQAGNDSYDSSKNYTPGSTEELTEAEMGEIITYAKNHGISIIPLINTPGHMTTLVSAMKTLGISSTSGSNMDLSDNNQCAFVKALMQKYISYFSTKGCTFFNMGADEYSFSSLNSDGYLLFVSYVNGIAELITNANMTPVAFNDGIYYKASDSGFATAADQISRDIVVAYWCQANNYASAATLANKGFTLLNNNDAWYYVYGDALYSYWSQGQWGYSDSKDALQNTDCTTFDTKDSEGVTAAGSVLCLWCDYPGEKEYTTDIQSKVYDLIATMAISNPTYFSVGDSGETETSEETIRVTVGGQETVTVSGDVSGTYDTEDTTVATVTAVASESEGTPAVKESYDKIETITSGSEYVIGDGTHWMVLKGSSLSYTTDYAQATKWTIASNGNGYTIKSGSYYLRFNNSSLSVSVTSTAWSYGDSGFYTKKSGMMYYLRWNGSSWEATNSNSNNVAPYTYTPAQDAIPGGTITTLTFTGLAEGTTTVVIGNVKYTVIVTKEDLSGASDLPIQLWITNGPISVNNVTTQTSGQFNAYNNGGYAQYTNIKAENAYGVNGVELMSLVPTGVSSDGSETTSDDTGAKYVLWKGTVLNTTTGLQGVWGTNKCNSGTNYAYVRYYEGAWAVSADRESWTEVTGSGSTESYSSCTEQIIAYYMQRTEITEHVITDTVDYGDILSDQNSSHGNISNGNYVILDYAVKYGNGTQVPDSFRQDGKTLLYHCAGTGDTGTANVYRRLNAIRATETSSYEVYMITITPTTDDTSATTFSAGTVPTTYTYDGTERVIWAESEDVIPEDYSTIADLDSSNYNYGEVTYGGEPTLDELNIYNRQGMLITYYIRGKRTEDSLQVKYVDDATGDVFYTTNIPVINTGEENKNFNNSLLDGDGEVYTVSGNTTLDDNTYYVVDTFNTNVYIRSDLTKIVDLKGVYSTGIYTHVKAEVDPNDPKILILHYTVDTSKTTKNFVIDFGLPVTVYASDLFDNINGIQALEKKNDGQFGKVTCSGTTFTYTPDKVLTTNDVVSVKVIYNDGTSSTINVGFIPATTVYYEEGFAELTGWTGGSKGKDTQATSAVGSKDHYGYDSKYAKEANGASNETQATSTAIGDDAIFTFTGTGVDIYANCTTKTGSVNVLVRNSTGSIVKLLKVDTKTGVGGSATQGQAVTSYSLPIVSLNGLERDTYTVTIRHCKTDANETESGVVYLDGFKVFETIDKGSEVYASDEEQNPNYTEVRNSVLKALQVNDDTSKVYAGKLAEQIYNQVDGQNGAVIISNNVTSEENAQDLLDNGPKNEIFLRPGESLAFTLGNGITAAQIGLKAVNDEVTYKINNGDDQSMTTSTDMFYQLSISGDRSVTITNDGNSAGILSITDLKWFGDLTSSTAMVAPTVATFRMALMSLGYEEEPTTADANLKVSVVDYKGTELASTSLTATGAEGEENVFAASEIVEAARSVLPDGYAFADESVVTEQSVIYGEEDSVNVLAGKVATLNVTYKKLLGKSVGTASLTKVQTSDSTKATFSASEIRAAVPDGYTAITLLGTSVKYGSESSKTVYVY